MPRLPKSSAASITMPSRSTNSRAPPVVKSHPPFAAASPPQSSFMPAILGCLAQPDDFPRPQARFVQPVDRVANHRPEQEGQRRPHVELLHRKADKERAKQWASAASAPSSA